MTNPPQLPKDVPLWPEESRPAQPQPQQRAAPQQPTPGQPLWAETAAPAAPPQQQPNAGSFSLPPQAPSEVQRAGTAPPPPPPAPVRAAPAAQPSAPAQAAPQSGYSYEISREPYDPKTAYPDYVPQQAHAEQGIVTQTAPLPIPPPLPPATTGGQKTLRVLRIGFGLFLRGLGWLLAATGRLLMKWGLKLAPPRRKNQA